MRKNFVLKSENESCLHKALNGLTTCFYVHVLFPWPRGAHPHLANEETWESHALEAASTTFGGNRMMGNAWLTARDIPALTFFPSWKSRHLDFREICKNSLTLAKLFLTFVDLGLLSLTFLSLSHSGVHHSTTIFKAPFSDLIPSRHQKFK